MPDEFYKFPRTPHLSWPLNRPPKNDRVLDSDSAREMLSAEVVVEEKVDGANLGLSVDERGEIRAQNRGSWLERRSHPQFNPMWSWISSRRTTLADLMPDGRIFFGEWCFAVHSVHYDRLPDWFLGFDVYETAARKFWSVDRRDEIFKLAEIHRVPRIFKGRVKLADLQKMLESEPSRLGNGPLEGLYIRRDDGEWLQARAKLVRPDFLQAIEEHWSSKPLKQNKLKLSA
jgi:RNA ligase